MVNSTAQKYSMCFKILLDRFFLAILLISLGFNLWLGLFKPNQTHASETLETINQEPATQESVKSDTVIFTNKKNLNCLEMYEKQKIIFSENSKKTISVKSISQPKCYNWKEYKKKNNQG